jgi:2-polyprenyl-3-methyl-5-hydroxy-6-metoxy-1,4-benzoquinol methylase
MHSYYHTSAPDFQRVKQQPWRTHIECFTLSELVGDVSGKRVLDLACGDGFYTRLLARCGAARVVGVDISEKMIERARQEEVVAPLGIEYRVGDARRLLMDTKFDLVLAGYLFNHARCPEELLRMCESIARCLKPAGRLVAVNNNPAQAPLAFETTRKYGFVKSLAGELNEGTPVTWRIFVGENSFALTYYYLSPRTHAWALRTAGLHHIQWHWPRLSPEAVAHTGADYWDDFLEQPPIIFLECFR